MYIGSLSHAGGWGMLCFVGSHFDIWHRYQRSSFANEEPGFYMYSQITVTEIYKFKTLSQTVKSFLCNQLFVNSFHKQHQLI